MNDAMMMIACNKHVPCTCPMYPTASSTVTRTIAFMLLTENYPNVRVKRGVK